VLAKVYTTPTCPWCKQAKALLRETGVPFEEIDVSKDRALVQELLSISGQLGVPVVTDGKTTIIGFDRSALETLAARAASRPIE